MAIDDNTSYELTGAQVKDLANKIKGKAADNTFVGATPAAPGSKGLVPEPQAGDNTKFLSGDGTWQTSPTVNNGALTIQQNGTTLNTFTANSSDDKTVNIQTITAETVAPVEEVGVITTNMIADGAVTASKIDPTSFAVLVYVGEIAFVRKTYNNSPISLSDKIDYYAASNVSAAITSSTNLVMTLPADGSYIARVKASLWTNANSWDYMLLTIRKNGNSFSKAMGPKNAGAWGFVNTEGYTTIANGDALSVYLNTNGNNFSDGNITRQDSKLIVEIYKVG